MYSYLLEQLKLWWLRLLQRIRALKHLHLFVLHLFAPLHPHFTKSCPPLLDVWITAWRREIEASWLTSFSVKNRSGQTSN